VPHIFAANTDDLFFAQGLVAAQDRLRQMEIWRRTGRGELAEVLGAGYIERDRYPCRGQWLPSVWSGSELPSRAPLPSKSSSNTRGMVR